MSYVFIRRRENVTEVSGAFSRKEVQGEKFPLSELIEYGGCKYSGNKSYESRFRQSGSRVANPCPGEVMGTVTSYWVLSAEK